MEYDVTIDRDKYIGGSDIPVIMGISPFKKRFDLVLEKAGLKEIENNPNKYTEYGHLMEPKIRDYVNKKYDKNFVPDQIILGKLRANMDGLDYDSVLEVKTTSQIYDDVNAYKAYLVQLIFYMEKAQKPYGLLAVYDRPDDFCEELDVERLMCFRIELSRYNLLAEKINTSIERFLEDVEKLKQNPLLTEEDLQPTDIVAIANKIIELETLLEGYKKHEQEHKNLKKSLYEEMEKHSIKKWETFNGIKITKVDEIPESVKTVKVFDEERFKSEYPDIYNKFVSNVQQITKAKSGYVRITIPKQ